MMMRKENVKGSIGTKSIGKKHSITFVKCVKGDMWYFCSQTDDDEQKILKVPEGQAILKKVGERNKLIKQ